MTTYYRKHIDAGLCGHCPRPLVTKNHCEYHRERLRLYDKKNYMRRQYALIMNQEPKLTAINAATIREAMPAEGWITATQMKDATGLAFTTINRTLLCLANEKKIEWGTLKTPKGRLIYQYRRFQNAAQVL